MTKLGDEVVNIQGSIQCVTVFLIWLLVVLSSHSPYSFARQQYSFIHSQHSSINSQYLSIHSSVYSQYWFVHSQYLSVHSQHSADHSSLSSQYLQYYLSSFITDRELSLFVILFKVTYPLFYHTSDYNSITVSKKYLPPLQFFKMSFCFVLFPQCTYFQARSSCIQNMKDFIRGLQN